MLQYLLTGLAGVALGIAAMRVMQSRDALSLQGHDETSENTFQEASDRAPGKSRKLLIGASALLAIAIAVLIFRDHASRPSLPSGPSSSVPDGKSAQLDDVNTMISRLAERLEKNPDDGEGFRMLGWSYVMTGKPDQAIAPYKQALRLLPGNALVLSGYGEALVGAAGGKVTTEAKGLFEQTLKLDPTEPRARHFEALWLSQNGKEKQALEKWIALVNSAPSDASWQADVMRRINDTAQKLGITVDGRIRPLSAGRASGSLPGVAPAAIQSANEMPAFGT